MIKQLPRLLSAALLTAAVSPSFSTVAVAAPQVPLAGEVTTTADDRISLWEEGTGAYNQPEWVKKRRYATTRVHIQRDPWEVAVEQWARGRLNHGDWSFRFQEEIEIGLPGRIQLDFYYDWTYEEHGDADFLDYAAEIRYGLADWGKIWGNPALYFEYKWTDDDRGGDVIEPKLLFGGDIGKKSQWGLNLVYERELSGEEAEEFQVTFGASTDVNEKFSVGVEAKFVRETVEGSRNDPEFKVLIGPSIQWRPTSSSHIDLAVLPGFTDDSPDIEAWFVGGIEFGHSHGRQSHAPVSGRR